ncbi:chromate transporter [Lihuaxuella thermophila]|uniref:Chromate transporter n=1 Tax=Lihuaxuella thermophila TaxID=1173111 RepID=A0A1H8FLR1_9BACL|nr:chromate transporter [Lihuaxuella thermophila]SEN32038.1 chromate transporter [Lihuaxuella thermophila]
MADETTNETQSLKTRNSVLEVLRVATRLGLTSFGGPIAHLGYFREEYVHRRKWLDEKTYADLVALCQFLPGPASSQVGIAIGMIRAGFLGALASWIGFTFPSALFLTLFAYLLQGVKVEELGWIHGLLVVSVAVVAQAVWGMARNLAPDRPRATIAILAAMVAVTWQTALGQVLIMIVAGFIGWWILPKRSVPESLSIRISLSRKAALFSLGLFFVLLLLLPLMRKISSAQWVAMFDSFYRTGSLVFGGGHVVLPLLQAEVVPNGWMSSDQFLAGYAAAQAVPGPLFTFAAYLGTVINGWPGALLATEAIFLSSFLLIFGTLPFWGWIRRQPKFQAALSGINAAVVGILLAALYDPVWTKTIHTPSDFSLALIAFGLLMIWKLPPWVVVVCSAIGGAVFSHF